MDTVNRLLALQTALVEKMGRQPYMSPSITISTDSRPYRITWYDFSIHDNDHRFYCETLEGVFTMAEEYLAQMPDPETAALNKFQRDLSDVIDSAPPSLDTSVLSKFNADLQENLLEYVQ